MASPHSPWRLHIESKSDSSSSTSVSAIALISDFLDLAHLSIQEEAALATNWIKDRPKGLKLQNLALASMTVPVLSSLPQNLTADVQYAINNCESLGPGQQLIFHGNPSAFAKDFSPMAVFRRHFLPNVHCQVLHVASGHPRVAILTSLRPVVNSLLGCSFGKPVQDQLA